MVIKEVNVKLRRRINLKDYEFADVECGLAADLDESDNPEEALLEISRMARDNVKLRSLPFVHKAKSLSQGKLMEIVESLPASLQEAYQQAGGLGGQKKDD